MIRLLFAPAIAVMNRMNPMTKFILIGLISKPFDPMTPAGQVRSLCRGEVRAGAPEAA